MGKKAPKADPAEGAELHPEAQANVLAMTRARMEQSHAAAEEGLATAAVETRKLIEAHAGLTEEMAAVQEDARDQYCFLQQQLDADFERISALERRAVVDGVALQRAEVHHTSRLARSKAAHAEMVQAQTRREEAARAALAVSRKALARPRDDELEAEAAPATAQMEAAATAHVEEAAPAAPDAEESPPDTTTRRGRRRAQAAARTDYRSTAWLSNDGIATGLHAIESTRRRGLSLAPLDSARTEQLEGRPPPATRKKKWRAALVPPALERKLKRETRPAPPAPDSTKVAAAAARYAFPTGDVVDRTLAQRARRDLRARRADLERTLAQETMSWERFRIRAKEDARRDVARRDVARRAEAVARATKDFSAAQITKDVDDAHRRTHERLRRSTRALAKAVRRHRDACATRLALFNEVGVAEDTAAQAEARLDAELETPSSSLPSTAGSDWAVSPAKHPGLLSFDGLHEERPRHQASGALVRAAAKDGRKYALRVQMLRRRGAAQLAAADAVVALVAKCAADARADAATEARKYDGLDAVFPPSRPGSRIATAKVVYPRRAAALAAQDRAVLLSRLAAAAHAHRVALRPFVEATVDPIRAVAGSPEPSTARSHISQSSVASSVSGFSLASSRRLTRKQQYMFSPVQALPRVSRRR